MIMAGAMAQEAVDEAGAAMTVAAKMMMVVVVMARWAAR